MISHFVRATVAAAALLSACGSPQDYAEPDVERVEPAQPVDPASDPVSAFARRDAPLAAVVRLNISGTAVNLEDLKLRSLAGRIQQPESTDNLITVIAVDGNGELVGSAATTDSRINVVEGQGIVEIENRVVSLAIPLDRRPQSLKISVPGLPPESARIIDVTNSMNGECKKYAEAVICRQPIE